MCRWNFSSWSRDEKRTNIFKKNGYPLSFIEKCIRKFVASRRKVNVQVSTVEKKRLLLVLPFLGNVSVQTMTKLKKTIRKVLNCCEIDFVFKTDCRLSSLFRFKDIVPGDLASSVVYSYVCGGCNATYYGQTKRHLKVRASEHIGISALTGKKIKPTRSAVSDHHQTCTHQSSFDDFKVLSRGGETPILEIKESLFIMRDSPLLNRTISSSPLYLFDKS